jgi:CDGSH-type Zn-finger protein/uncharacterized Fe-S cluster protein YjdI
MPRKIREYLGEAIVIEYDAVRCIHAAECVRGLPPVFDQHRRPWIDPSQASPSEIAEVVARCPTGALTFRRLDEGPDEAVPQENTLRLSTDGPLFASGDILVEADGAVVFRGTRVALCRCGDSHHKPFCDGEHVKAGFSDPGEITTSPPASDAEIGTLTITLAANGPLLLRGPFHLVSADGSQSACMAKGAFCRCGKSGSKPICDGSHKGKGFEG